MNLIAFLLFWWFGLILWIFLWPLAIVYGVYVVATSNLTTDQKALVFAVAIALWIYAGQATGV